MGYDIITHLKYSLWANGRMVDSLKPVAEEIIFREFKSSFTSIAKTVLHIGDAETVWLKRLQGTSLTAQPSEGSTHTKDFVLSYTLNSSRALLALAEASSPGFFESSYAYKNLKGEPFTSRVIDTLFHVVNHGSYHRGQVTTMLREAGVVDILSMDLIHYLRSRPA